MTNIVYRITWPKNTAEDDVRTVLVRIYGEGADIFFDREEEIRTFGLISTHGHGPHLLAKFPEGRVEEFIHAKPDNCFVNLYDFSDRKDCLRALSEQSENRGRKRQRRLLSSRGS
ncbi:putative ethanolamine kinase [Helianthus annuus]|nr:putative ethanolamine kinase [Helianthus annuus]